MTRLLHMLLTCALVLICAPALAATPDEVGLLLDGWQMEKAAAEIEALEKRHGLHPDVLFLKARHAFLDGRYKEAEQRLEELAANDDRAEVKNLLDLVKNTVEVVDGYERHLSPKGHFAIYVEPGKDRVLLPWVFEALDSAYEALGDELGYRPEGPIRVEVYPRTSVLAKVSILTEEEIRTSGTIALCKYNRLMITSPKALVRGYPWVDTVVHEYVHYVVNRKTANQVPIWMHEGLAKFLERRWRGPGQHRLAPSSEELLQRRVAERTLITFDQMHPSMAKLPSQEDAAVAFAEVYTAMEYLQERAGERAFHRLLTMIAEGEDARTAFAAVLGTTFPAFERDWRRTLTERPPLEFSTDDGAFTERLVFRDAKEPAEIRSIKQPEARDHINLGTMLHVNGRPKAAVVQYRKAANLLGDRNPVLQTRLARALLEVGDARGAYDALLPVQEAFPSYVSTWLYLGRASVELEQFAEAERHLAEAARINPFNPEVHGLLAVVYEKLGRVDEANRSREFAKIVN